MHNELVCEVWCKKQKRKSVQNLIVKSLYVEIVK